MIRSLSRRWADPLLRAENRRLRYRNKYLARVARERGEAMKTLEHTASVNCARIGELLRDRDFEARRADGWRLVAEQHRAELDAMKEKT